MIFLMTLDRLQCMYDGMSISFLFHPLFVSVVFIDVIPELLLTFNFFFTSRQIGT